ncbi:MAG: CT583 family protein [Simkaniaceae bacterium]|nr:CT583 family protein [Simkaniaceae bacterium]
MSKLSSLNSLIMGRLKSRDKEKVRSLAVRSASGSLSGFSGVFRPVPATEKETALLRQLLERHGRGGVRPEEDLEMLIALTSEVKAIAAQAVILHGERILRVRDLLKKYGSGAFSAWLIHTYGNRQTPYNFLHYYEFYTSLSDEVRAVVDDMPKQAIYTLAGRHVARERKIAFIERYRGETKTELLAKLRKEFPLSQKDGRREDRVRALRTCLTKALYMARDDLFAPEEPEAEEIRRILQEIHSAF